MARSKQHTHDDTPLSGHHLRHRRHHPQRLHRAAASRKHPEGCHRHATAQQHHRYSLLVLRSSPAKGFLEIWSPACSILLSSSI